MQKLFLGFELYEEVEKIIGKAEKVNAMISINEKQVEGYLLELENTDLWRLDTFLIIPVYNRIVVTAKTNDAEVEAFYYVKNPFITSEEPLYDMSVFDHFCSNNEMGMYDMHLLYPCCTHDFDIKQAVEDKYDICQKMFERLDAHNQYELRGGFVKDLSRYFLGFVKIYPDLRKKKYPQWCMVSLVKHDATEVGVLYVSMISSAFPGHHVLTDFCSRSLLVENEEQVIEDWIEKKGIKIYGTPRSLVFSYNEMSDDAILNALVSEAVPSGDVIGERFTNALKKNLAQYDTAKAYASEVCLIEIADLKDSDMDISQRVEAETIELFFVELLLLQDAAISRVSAKILKHLESESKKKSTINDSILEDLICEMAQAILFFDLNEFLFPTVRDSAENIAKCFGIDRQMSMYEKYKNILEQLITIRKERVDEIRDSSLNSLLLILSFAQILPLFISGFKQILLSEFALTDWIVYVCGMVSCFTLWGIYRLNMSLRIRRKKRGKRTS